MVEVAEPAPVTAREPRHLIELDLITFVVVVAALQLVIGRMIVPHYQPPDGVSPKQWHAVMAWTATFLRHFLGVLAPAVLVVQGYLLVVRRQDLYSRPFTAPIAGAALVTAVTCVIAAFGVMPDRFSLAPELAFAALTLAVAASVLRARADLPSRLALVLAVIPVLLHATAAIGAETVQKLEGFRTWPDELRELAQWGVAVIGLSAPLLFGPRPLGQAVLHPLPLATTVILSGLAPILVRRRFDFAAELAQRGFGIQLAEPSGSDVLWLLALLGMVWTIAASVVSRSRGRRAVAAGLALLTAGGFSYQWPYLIAIRALGFLVLLEAIPDAAHDEQQLSRGLAPRRAGLGPLVDPLAWKDFTIALQGRLAKPPLALTDAETDLRSADAVEVTRVGARRDGLPLRLTVTRDDDGIQSIVITCGGDVPAEAPAWTLAARSSNPFTGGGATPPTSGGKIVKTGDAGFDKRFSLHDTGGLSEKLLDEGLRARATAILDGWIALWPGRALRWVVTPGRGAPHDTPIALREIVPFAEMPVEPLVRVVDLITEIAARADLPKT